MIRISHKLTTDSFKTRGFQQIPLDLPLEVKDFIERKDYPGLDRCLGELLKKGGLLHQTLLRFGPIHQTEYLIAIRDAKEDDEGIWHDDGSRDLAFTLSLVLDLEQLEGGVLLFRKKDNQAQIQSIPTAPYGTLTVIKTGKSGYEHRVQKVTSGTRLICAGWVN